MTGIELESARIETPATTLLAVGDLCIPPNQVVVIVGPAGTGKSLLMRALADEPLGGGAHRGGQWSPSRAKEKPRIGYCPQTRAPHIGVDARTLPVKEPLQLLSEPYDILLLDEPERSVPRTKRTELTAAIRQFASHGTVVVSTHHLEFARTIADQIIFLCAGKLQCSGPAAEFFATPPTPLARRFVQHGNCWPSPETPMLPSHFNWILPGALAGMAQPGSNGNIEDDLHAIAVAGVSLLVTLTEKPFPINKVHAVGIESAHLPIRDMGVPRTDEAATVCANMERIIGVGGAAAVHCRAGVGRTGTMIAT